MLAQALIEVQRTQVVDGQLGTLDNLSLVIVNIPFLKLHRSNGRKHLSVQPSTVFRVGQPDRIVSFNSIST